MHLAWDSDLSAASAEEPPSEAFAPRTTIPRHLDPAAALGDARRLAMVPEPASLPRAELDALATLASAILGAPRALVSMLTRDEQQAVASFGCPLPDPDPVELSICAFTVALGDPLLLGDITEGPDPVLPDRVEPGLRAYAGTPLRVAGERVGTLCVTDPRARAWTLRDAERLEALGVMGSLLLERSARDPGRAR